MKISKFIYAAVVGGVLASCQSVDTPMFSDKDAFVAFDSKTTSIAENARSEEHTSELQSQSLISYAVFCLKSVGFAGK